MYCFFSSFSFSFFLSPRPSTSPSLWPWSSCLLFVIFLLSNYPSFLPLPSVSLLRPLSNPCLYYLAFPSPPTLLPPSPSIIPLLHSASLSITFLLPFLPPSSLASFPFFIYLLHHLGPPILISILSFIYFPFLPIFLFVVSSSFMFSSSLSCFSSPPLISFSRLYLPSMHCSSHHSFSFHIFIPFVLFLHLPLFLGSVLLISLLLIILVPISFSSPFLHSLLTVLLSHPSSLLPLLCVFLQLP